MFWSLSEISAYVVRRCRHRCIAASSGWIGDRQAVERRGVTHRPCVLRERRSVMNARRPECDEQPSKPSARYVRLNQTTMLIGVIAPPRSERMTGSWPSLNRRASLSA